MECVLDVLAGTVRHVAPVVHQGAHGGREIVLMSWGFFRLRARKRAIVRIQTNCSLRPAPSIVRCLVCIVICLGSGQFNSAPAQQTVEAAELVGSIIEASVTNLQTGLRDGRRFDTPYKQDWTIELAEIDTIRVTFAATAFTKMGEKRGGPDSAVVKLGIPRAMLIAPRGGGHGVWFFDGNVLTFLRTYEGGAMKATFAVSRTGPDLRCNASVSWPKEVGVPTIRLRSLVDDAKVEIVSATQTASSCRIAKKS